MQGSGFRVQGAGVGLCGKEENSDSRGGTPNDTETVSKLREGVGFVD